MSDKSIGIIDVLNRLKMVFNLPDEASLASLLGMSKSALNNRKRRDSMPTAAIDNLLNKEGINPEYIYKGTGRVTLENEGHTWQDGFLKRLQHLSIKTTQDLLIREGHTLKDIKAVLAGKQRPSIELLRDLQRITRIDLNWLINAEIAETPTQEEQALLQLYRKAGAERQKAVLASLIVADNTPQQQPQNIKQKAGKQSVQVAGDLQTQSINLGQNLGGG